MFQPQSLRDHRDSIVLGTTETQTYGLRFGIGNPGMREYENTRLRECEQIEG
jgi:hypothetical protein